ncbi:MAG: hypothetical protein J6333_03655 [Planctomycetes bacterium]|nr:hypothetical protein [Planctomycetota bacterium]
MPTLPPNIENCAKQINRLDNREGRTGHLTFDERHQLALAKLRLAVWACSQEKVPLTRYALSEILGPDTAFVFANALQEMLVLPWQSDEDRKWSAKHAQADGAAHGGKGAGRTSPFVKIYR